MSKFQEYLEQGERDVPPEELRKATESPIQKAIDMLSEAQSKTDDHKCASKIREAVTILQKHLIRKK